MQSELEHIKSENHGKTSAMSWTCSTLTMSIYMFSVVYCTINTNLKSIFT